MKNQYFADVGDYGKYGLLRFLDARGISIAVNWYLTPDDPSSNDGKFRSYLNKESYGIYDPDLFHALREIKDIQGFQEQSLIPNAVYYDRLLLIAEGLTRVEKVTARARWHEQAQKVCEGASLVFMDPDNGLRDGKPTVRRDAIKFVYASEICDYYDAGLDVVYYCHKGRRKPDRWERAKRVMKICRQEAALMGVTYHRGTQRSYIFVVHPEREEQYRLSIKAFLETSGKDAFSEEPVV